MKQQIEYSLDRHPMISGREYQLDNLSTLPNGDYHGTISYICENNKLTLKDFIVGKMNSVRFFN